METNEALQAPGSEMQCQNDGVEVAQCSEENKEKADFPQNPTNPLQQEANEDPPNDGGGGGDHLEPIGSTFPTQSDKTHSKVDGSNGELENAEPHNTSEGEAKDENNRDDTDAEQKPETENSQTGREDTENKEEELNDNKNDETQNQNEDEESRDFNEAESNENQDCNEAENNEGQQQNEDEENQDFNEAENNEKQSEDPENQDFNQAENNEKQSEDPESHDLNEAENEGSNKEIKENELGEDNKQEEADKVKTENEGESLDFPENEEEKPQPTEQEIVEQNKENEISNNNEDNEQNAEELQLEHEGDAEPEQDAEPEPEHVDGMSVKDQVSKDQFERPVTAKELPLLETDPNIERRCRAILDRYKKTHKTSEISDTDQRKQFFQFLNREKVNMVAQEKFAEAHELQEIAAAFALSEQKIVGIETIEQKLASFEDRIDEAEREIKRLHAECEKKLKDFQNDANSQRVALKNKHSRELDDFEHRWNDSEYLKRFTKPSPKLIQLVVIEKNTICGKMFDRADEIKKIVMQQEKEESMLAQEKAVHNMNSDRMKLDKKFASELLSAEQHFALGEKTIVNEYTLKINTLTARKLRMMQQVEELNSLKCKGILPPLKQALTSRGKKNLTITPRTQNRFALCKNSVRAPKVTIKPLGHVAKKKTRSSTVIY